MSFGFKRGGGGSSRLPDGCETAFSPWRRASSDVKYLPTHLTSVASWCSGPHPPPQPKDPSVIREDARCYAAQLQSCVSAAHSITAPRCNAGCPPPELRAGHASSQTRERRDNSGGCAVRFQLSRRISAHIRRFVPRGGCRGYAPCTAPLPVSGCM